MSRVDEVLNQLSGPGPSMRGITPDATLEDYPNELRQAATQREPVSQPSAVAVPPVVLREAPPQMSVPAADPAPVQRPRAAVRRTAHAVDAASNGKVILSGQVPPVTIEQYRRVAAALHEAQQERGLKRLMVASALPHDGKTLTAINLSLTLSESYGQRVLLIDADLRRPSVHKVLKLSNRLGLTDHLKSESHDPQGIIELSTCFSVLPAGREDASPLAGLTSGRMKEILDHAASDFDWVLVDTPPLGLLPDAQVISRLVDGVILVVSAGVTPYQPVQRAIADVGADRILGVVLNRADVTMTMSSYYESYYINSDINSRGAAHG